MSLVDVQAALVLAYTEINDRPTPSLQHGDILTFLSSPAFFTPFLAAILADISATLGVPMDRDAVSKRLSAYTWMNGTETAKNTQIAYDALVDLLAARLASKSIFRRNLEFTREFDSQDTAEEIKVWNLQLQDLQLERVSQREEIPDRLSTYLAKGVQQVKAHRPWVLIDASKKSKKELADLVKMVQKFDSEYQNRISVMIMRLCVTLQAFLRSPRAAEKLDDIAKELASLEMLASKQHMSPSSVLSATTRLLKPVRLSGITTASFLKKIVIRGVPDRGGVPEGFGSKDISIDVRKANLALQMKDHDNKPKFGKSLDPKRQVQDQRRATEWIGNTAALASVKPEWRAEKVAIYGQLNQQEGGEYRGFCGTYQGCRFPENRMLDPPPMVKQSVNRIWGKSRGRGENLSLQSRGNYGGRGQDSPMRRN